MAKKPIQSTFGELLSFYWQVAGLEPELRGRLGGDFPRPEDLLPAMLEALPAGTGIQTLGELESVLETTVGAMSSDAETPKEVQAEFERILTPEEMTFNVPLGFTDDIVDASVGGRFNLRLATYRYREQLACRLEGTSRQSHWVVAARAAMECAEEMLGCLAAVGVARIFPTSVRRAPDEQAASDLVAVWLSGAMKDDPSGKWEEFEPLSVRQRLDISVTRLCHPPPESDLEVAEERRHGTGVLRDRRIQVAARAFQTPGMDAQRVRRAARFFRKALTSDSPGDAYLFMATALEGLLVEGKADLAARVADAVSFLIGRSHAERAEVRELASHLYEVRSRYVHQGEYSGSERQLLRCQRLVGQVLERELRTLAGPRGETVPSTASAT